VDAGFVVSTFVLHGDTTLDCQGHKIRDSTRASSYGVYVLGENNVVVKNCTFDGFYQGIHISNTPYYRVENNRFVNGRGWASLEASGNEGLIRANTFHSPVPYAGSFGFGWEAILSNGDGLGNVDILDNTILIGRDPALGNGDSRSGIIANGNGVIARNLVHAHLNPEQSGSGIDPSLSIAYRNMLVGTPGSHWLGMRCYLNQGFYFQNVILGSSAVPTHDCSTNLPSG